MKLNKGHVRVKNPDTLILIGRMIKKIPIDLIDITERNTLLKTKIM